MICWKQVDLKSFGKKKHTFFNTLYPKSHGPTSPARTFEFTELPQAPEEMEGQVTLRNCWDTASDTHM